jgi:hypothetical protein
MAMPYDLEELLRIAADDFPVVGEDQLVRLTVGALCACYFTSFGGKRVGFSHQCPRWRFRDWIDACFGMPDLTIEMVFAGMLHCGYLFNTERPAPASIASIRSSAFIHQPNRRPRAVAWAELHRVLPPIKIV